VRTASPAPWPCVPHRQERRRRRGAHRHAPSHRHMSACVTCRRARALLSLFCAS
jgi:hypothetical protein